MIRPGSILYRVIALPGVLLIRFFEFWIRLVQGDRAFEDASEFPWVARVEREWPAIRRELDEILLGREPVPEFPELSEEQRRITTGQWRSFFFVAYGRRIDDNCRRCPRSAAALEHIPGMVTAMFSILAPGARLEPHRGPFKGVLRYHLALKVPADREACGLRVDREVRHWTEGRSLIFDDTHEHEAWNDSREERVVLFVDFLRELPFPLGWLNRGMVALIAASPFVRNIVTKVNAWNRRVADVT